MDEIGQFARDERTARMVLALVSAPADVLTGRLVAAVGAVETLRLSREDGAAGVLSEVEAEVWRGRLAPLPDPAAARSMLDQALAQGFGTVIPGDQHFPVGLQDLGDRVPLVLWTRGAPSFLSRPLSELVVVTGARASSAYGNYVAADFAADLGNAERLIVAGGGYGVEAAAHQAVLSVGGSTIAVLPCGLDRPYPAGHRDLLGNIGDVGLLVSELPPGTPPSRRWFQARNRIIAALAGATVITEASSRSLAMLTAMYAHDLGRGVGIVPGPITSGTSVGSNELIKRGVGRVVTTAADVTNLLDHPTTATRRNLDRDLHQRARPTRIPPEITR
ncbi:DNA-processing protein DprA [Microlunatus sp. GCM10028923]|uniref:DNA-processing protein DprA n=1 Tax=Microlunatus sp. GCM10028923 TaxID=3273400 RepID=UPI003618EFE5